MLFRRLLVLMHFVYLEGGSRCWLICTLAVVLQPIVCVEQSPSMVSGYFLGMLGSAMSNFMVVFCHLLSCKGPVFWGSDFWWLAFACQLDANAKNS